MEKPMQQAVDFDADLIRRYAGSGPRYTSYPTAMEFSPDIGAADHERWVRASNDSGRPLSLYVHIPFCAHVCYYCACNKIVTADRSRARNYLDHLYREIRLQALMIDPDRRVEQLHFGGGTPTFLSEKELCELMGVLRENFHLSEDDSGEYSIEIDPREGYQYIGMDHFALRDDELAQAQRTGSLHRNFQGYSTHADSDLVAMGVSAISSMPGGYTQNHTDVNDYYRDLDEAHLPVARGVAINDDDRLRAEVIQQLICHGSLDMRRVESEFGIRFDDYFQDELKRLQPMQSDGLLDIDDRQININERGGLLIRNICKVFDRYRNEQEANFSKMI